VRVAKAKEIIRDIPKHTLFNDKAGGGGGYGDPLLRPEGKVLEDVRNGVVSIASAREDYGVMIHEKTLSIDREATRALRGETA
jgi:N-methylhydantoinase B